MKGPEFHHVALNICNYAKAVSFYKQFGFELFAEWQANGFNHCFLSLQGLPCLELHETDKTALTENRIQHFCIHVDSDEEVDRLYNFAITHGGAEKTAPYTHTLNSFPTAIPHARIAHIYGADGESIELIHWEL